MSNVDEARLHPRRGDERLSGKQNGDPSGAAARNRTTEDKVRGAKKAPKKAGDVGRALRTIYDDTVREPVPDDFLNLLGKLS
jgi:hypothetical protein